MSTEPTKKTGRAIAKQSARRLTSKSDATRQTASKSSMPVVKETTVTRQSVREAQQAGHEAPQTKAPWPRPIVKDEWAEPARPQGAVKHDPEGEPRGRRHSQFPQLNITETAKRLDVTKSHLSRVLSGENRPSVPLAMKLAEVLGWPIDRVLSLYRD